MTNTQASLLEQLAGQVRARFEGEGSGHDWWHIWRVWQNAQHIAQVEGADAYVVGLGALLHDIADHKFHGGDHTLGAKVAREWMQRLGVEAPIQEHVCAIVDGVSFKGAGVNTDMPTLEGKVVQDADRLDAIGAVGIARAFAFGGSRGRLLYDPDAIPELHADFEAYKRNNGCTVSHFHEKLLLLRDRMQTAEGKRMAQQRHAYMEGFLEQFHAEWQGQR